MKKGRFITLEGIEGVGKSTQIEFIKNVLEAYGVSKVVITREFGGTPIAEDIRRILIAHHEEPMTFDAELLLIFAARSQHVRNLVIPSLDKGEWVLCDRYIDSSYAYQGAGRGIPSDMIEWLDKWICQQCQPDLTILFDAPVQVALSRIQERAKADRFEVEEELFFQRIRECYLARAAFFPTRFRVVDAAVSPESVQNQLEHVLKEFLEKQ